MLNYLSIHFMNVLFVVCTVVVVFCTVVIVHEFGHFLVAKLLKIRVEAFAVGFGPKLIGFRKGETEYKICAIPLGGFVKMTGENPGEELKGSIEEFMSRPKWQRFLVAVMGPVMNVLLALFLLAGLYYYEYEAPAFLSDPVVVGSVAYQSPAEKAGILPGDRIVQAGDKSNPTWEQMFYVQATSPNRPLPLEIERHSQKLAVVAVPEAKGREKAGYLGISPPLPYDAAALVISKVAPGKPAAEAGIQPGDKIVAAAGVNLQKSDMDISTVLQNVHEDIVPITVFRNNQEITLEVKPYRDPATQIRMIGIERVKAPERLIVKKLSLGQAFRESINQNVKNAQLIIEILRKLFRNEVPIRMLEGPIGIGFEAAQAARSGFSDLLMLIALISLNLGVLNLLPIPIMDGGVIMILLVEALIRKNLSLKLRERIAQASVVLLLALALVVTYNDIVRRLPASVEKYFP